MSTPNIGFYEDLKKLSLDYHQISSNMHLISSAVPPLTKPFAAILYSFITALVL